MNSALTHRVATAVNECIEHRTITGAALDEYLSSVLRDIHNQRARPPRTLPAEIAKAFGTRNQGGNP